MDQTRLRALENQCIQDCPPPCTASCPVHVDVRQMALAASRGDFSNAHKVFRKTVPFPQIIARTCHQPCQRKCYRETVGGVIEVANIELACVLYGADSTDPIALLPKKSGRVAVVGGGLSGLTTAYELSRKGYHVRLFEKSKRLGGCLWDFPTEKLPGDVITRETEILLETGVDIVYDTEVSRLRDLAGDFDAIYLGSGAQDSGWDDLKHDPGGVLEVDPVTFQTSLGHVFAGGSLLHAPSTILSISDGRRAAISIDRYLQKVSLTASRVNEGSHETQLYTNISEIKPVEPALILDHAVGYTREEAQAEALRCLQCECMECVKVCEYLDHYGSYPRKYVREIYNNLSIIMRTRSSNKMINSCTLCGLCGEVCPTGLDMGTVALEARQTMVNKAKMPISAHDFALRDMAFSNSERFAATLLPAGQDICTHMLFPGCQLAASNPDYIPQLYETLAGVFPGLGVMLRCCGAPAEWSGETELISKAMDEFKAEWEKAGKPRLILACSSCNQIIKKHLQEVETISIWEIFEQHHLFPADRGKGNSYMVHDPCTSRYEPGWQNAARRGLTAMGIEFHELKMSRNLTECCGYGGVAWLAHPELVRDIIRRRVSEDQADYLTYCVMCRDLFAAEGKPTLHLLDLLYGKDMDQLSSRKGPDYSQRHENRVRTKNWMLKLIAGKDQTEVESYESFRIILSQDLRSLIASRLILVEDIQKVIEHAESTREFFIDQECGHVLASFKPNLITYWVEYSKIGDEYRIHDAYSHRMNLEGGGSL